MEDIERKQSGIYDASAESTEGSTDSDNTDSYAYNNSEEQNEEIPSQDLADKEIVQQESVAEPVYSGQAMQSMQGQYSGQTAQNMQGQYSGQTAQSMQGQYSGQTAQNMQGQYSGQTTQNTQGQYSGQTAQNMQGQYSGQTAQNMQGQYSGQTTRNTQGQYSGQQPYVNVAQYSNPYGGNAYTTYGQVKPKKVKKKHPAFRKVMLNILCGVLFGLFAGLGIYVIYSVSGTGNRFARVDVLESRVKEMEAQLETLGAGNMKKPATEQPDTDAGESDNGIGPKKRDIELEGTNQETQIPQMETQTVTAVVTDVTEVVKTAMPCVVSITNLYTSMDWYGEETQGEASGSGIIVGENDDELLIVTNYHVIADCDELSVQFINDAEVLAYVKGYNPENDLAVITVFLEDIGEDTRNQIAIATLGDSEALQVGEPAIAIGNSLGYGQSVTTGVISALNREVTIEDTTSYLIQTDAAINPGNSGGALLNVKGEVIGINSNKIADYVIEGMGYAIPISTAKPIIEELMQHETKRKVSDSERSFLGISGTDVTSDVSETYDMPKGVYIAQVLEDSAAESAGLQKGDIITKFDGEGVTTMTQLQGLLEYYAAGSSVDITVMRQSDGGYKELTINVTLGYKKE